MRYHSLSLEGVAALYGYESQIPEISRTKIEGLTTHYGVTSDEGLSFFRVHEEADVLHREAERDMIAELVRDRVSAGQDGQHTRHGERRCRVDRADARVRHRARQGLSEGHALGAEIFRVFGAARHLVEAVVLDGRGADDLVLAVRVEAGFFENGRHDQAPLISFAAA
mgnify:CR=1 FL=1